MTKEESIRNKIIEVLSENWPLSAKQIYNKLQRSHGVSVSYQAVHKQLKLMLEEKIILKNEKNLSLNSEWIENKKSFFENLGHSLDKKDSKKEVVAVLLSFEKFIDIGRFVLNEFFNLSNSKNKPFISLVYHAWPSIVLSDKMFKQFKEFHSKTKHYLLVSQDTLIDKTMGKTFEENNASIKYGINLPFTPDTLVSGNFIAYVYFDARGSKTYDKFCQTTKSLKNLNLEELFNTLFEMPFKHKILLVNNKEIADEIRENTIKEFKRKKGRKND